MNRDHALQRLAAADVLWDVLVIGGGATGLGIAVDAAARGYRTALVEQHDFAKGTSSRSTKLAHGGVRYLRSGEIGLVRGALRERGLLERNAPHLVHRRGFVIPIYRWFDLPVYGLGLKVYEWLSGKLSFGASQILSAAETRRLLPTVKTEGLRGGVLYFDGQFDDARLALALARTADDLGAAVVNYARVERLLKFDADSEMSAGCPHPAATEKRGEVTPPTSNDPLPSRSRAAYGADRSLRRAGTSNDRTRVVGAEIVDQETGRRFAVQARVVINATGIFTDEIRRLDDPRIDPLLAVSSGVHLALDRRFLPGDHALMIPGTADGRVLFAVPWQDHVILGTTDESRTAPELEPRPLEREVQFLLEHAAHYLALPVSRADVLSVFTGLRPLVRAGNSAATKSLSRDHVIAVSPSGLVTITGGKWTSYRKMAEDAVTRAADVGGLEPRKAETANMRLHGALNVGAALRRDSEPMKDHRGVKPLLQPIEWQTRFAHYGAEAVALAQMIAADPALGRLLHPRLEICAAQVVWAARHEMARTVDDVLSRRIRALQLDARAAVEAAPVVADLLARELGRDRAWVATQVETFMAIARGYLPETA